MWVLQGELLGIPEVSSIDSILACFCCQKLWGLIFLVLEPWAGEPGMGLGLLVPDISLPNFYPPNVPVPHLHSFDQSGWTWFL